MLPFIGVMNLRTRNTTLLVLMALVALNAIGGGIYGLTGASGVPKEWLNGSPFETYFVPSLILLFVVGGSSCAASLGLFLKYRHAMKMSLIAAMILITWIVVEIAIIGYVSWLQPATGLIGIWIGWLAKLAHKSVDG